MNSARERAVEAGAVQLCWGPGGTSLEGVPVAMAGRFREMSRDVIRAAFPILAEELVREAFQHGYERGAGGYIGEPGSQEDMALAKEQAWGTEAQVLRARIQRMAEAL
jgi:hypothetical protein